MLIANIRKERLNYKIIIFPNRIGMSMFRSIKVITGIFVNFSRLGQEY